MQQIERALHAEIMLRLRLAKPRCTWFPVPNGLFFPAKTPAERSLVARIVHRMKVSGMLTPGVSDLVFLWKGGCGCIELKRPASVGVPKGTLSEAQLGFKETCEMLGVPYRIATAWDDVKAALIEWGVWR